MQSKTIIFWSNLVRCQIKIFILSSSRTKSILMSTHLCTRHFANCVAIAYTLYDCRPTCTSKGLSDNRLFRFCRDFFFLRVLFEYRSVVVNHHARTYDLTLKFRINVLKFQRYCNNIYNIVT